MSRLDCFQKFVSVTEIPACSSTTAERSLDRNLVNTILSVFFRYQFFQIFSPGRFCYQEFYIYVINISHKPVCEINPVFGPVFQALSELPCASVSKRVILLNHSYANQSHFKMCKVLNEDSFCRIQRHKVTGNGLLKICEKASFEGTALL